MFGKNSQLTPLQLRKQMLLAESDLNRAQLQADWFSVETEVHALTHRIRTVGCIVSTATALLAVLAAWRRPAPAPVAQKTSWLQALLQGAGLLVTFWKAGRPVEQK